MAFDLMQEKGIIKKDWRMVDLTFGLVYPNRYKFAISSYSIRFLYHFINSRADIVCERFVLPDKISYPAFKNNSSMDSVRSIETKILAKEFDILGFSIHFENDFKNILWFLDKSNIPIFSKDRQTALNHHGYKAPLLIAGGPAITSNPLPLSKIIDFFFLGDAEPNLHEFLDYCIEFKLNKITFNTLIQKTGNIGGIYIPTITAVPKRMILTDLDKSIIPIHQLFSEITSESKLFESSYFLELNRGCPYKCKFCISSYHNYPFRNRSYGEIVKYIDDMIQFAEFESFAFIGSCVSSHPRFIDICNYILKSGKKFSIPSIRIDHITPEMIKTLEEANTKTITIAPEVGSDSLRFEIGKKINNEKILHTLALIKKSKIKHVKFYFLIGIPNEYEEDIKAIVNLFKDINDLGFNPGDLKVNINPFVPKLNTPYYNEVNHYFSENFSILRSRFQYLVTELSKIKSIKLKVVNIKKEMNDSLLQTIFSVGDERTNDLLVEFYHNGATMRALKNSCARLSFNFDDYLLSVKNAYNPWQPEIIEK